LRSTRGHAARGETPIEMIGKLARAFTRHKNLHAPYLAANPGGFGAGAAVCVGKE
jgi:hypothetical protein